MKDFPSVSLFVRYTEEEKEGKVIVRKNYLGRNLDQRKRNDEIFIFLGKCSFIHSLTSKKLNEKQTKKIKLINKKGDLGRGSEYFIIILQHKNGKMIPQI